ncbi:Integrase [Theobroma cacao]|nr:Integrase [Theobroma cacao]
MKGRQSPTLTCTTAIAALIFSLILSLCLALTEIPQEPTILQVTDNLIPTLNRKFSRNYVHKEFQVFVEKYGKNYSTTEEYMHRLGIFAKNLIRAAEHQVLDPTAVHGVTQFSDLSEEEFERLYTGVKGGMAAAAPRMMDGVGSEAEMVEVDGLPESFDWREKGAVTEVKMQCSDMTSKQIIADLTKGAKLDGKNYDIWHKKVQYLLNEQELLDHLTKEMNPLEAGNTAQHHRDQEAYDTWYKRDRSARFTMLSCMHDDFIREFENFLTAKQLWEQLKFKYGGTTVTRLRALTLKFNQYVMDSKHTMAEHLRAMSAMIREMKTTGYDLTDKQQTFDDISRHLELEAKRIEVICNTALIAQAGNRKGHQAPKGQAWWKKDKSKLKCFNCAHSLLGWIVDTGATKHITCNRARYVDYHRLPMGRHFVMMRNGEQGEVLGVGTYQLTMHNGRKWLLHDMLYTPSIRYLDSNNDVAFVSNSSFDVVNDSVKWHARLGYIRQNRMSKLARERLLGSITKVKLPTCEPCLAGKSSRKPFGKAKRATHLLEFVHSDICGPMNVKARNGASYFITFIDDYSRYGSIFLLSHRSEALNCFKRFMAEVENQKEMKLNVFRTDRGREYLSDQFKELCEEKGIRRQVTIPGTPQQNDVAERKNCTLLDMVRYSKHSKGYVMYGEHLDGGLTEMESRDVDFLEDDFPTIGEVKENLELYEMEEPQENVSQHEEMNVETHPIQETVEASGSTPILVDVDEPSSYEEALNSPSSDKWLTTMEYEMKSMTENQVWELVDLLPEHKAIENKWVLKVKHKADGSIEKYKAHLVAKGYTQKEGVDYKGTFSPVVRFTSIRLILAIVAHLDLELFQMDVKIAFLNGEINEEIYMN